MSPKSKEQYEAIRQRSMAAIKEAALELFARNGYHSTSISQIAKAAGISKGLIYNYFESKEDLLNSIIMDAVEVMEKEIGKFLTGTDDPFEQLKGMTESSFNMVKANLHYWKLLTSLIFQTDALKGLESQLMRKQKEAIDQTVGIFRRLGVENPEKEAYFFGALLDGVMLHYMQLEDYYPLDEMKDFILKRYSKSENAAS